MASLANTGCNTLERNIDGPQPKENNFDLIPLLFPPAQQPEIRAPAQRTFKRKMVSFLCQSRKLRQHQAPRSACGQFGEKRRKPRCNQIGIDEVNDSAFARKILSRKCRFPGSIRPHNHDAARRLCGPLPHLNITTSSHDPSLSGDQIVLPHSSKKNLHKPTLTFLLPLLKDEEMGWAAVGYRDPRTRSN